MAPRRRIEAEDLYRLRFVADPQISPDGSRVAYVVAWVDPSDHTRYRSQIMLVDADGQSPPRALTSGRHRDTSPRWAPDGSSLAFASDRDADRSQLFVLPLGGGEARQLTKLKHGVGAAVWAPDSSHIAFAASTDVAEIASQEGQSDEKGKQPRVKIIQRVRYKGDGEGFFEARRRHLFVVAVDGGQPRQITDGDWDDAEPTWSPDGEQIAFVSNRDRDRDLSLLDDIWVVPAQGGRARRVTRHRGQAASPSWSPDGGCLGYLGHERGYTYGAQTELMVVEPSGGPSRSVSGAAGGEMGNVSLSDTRDPFSSLPPRWLPDSSGLLSLNSSHGRVVIARVHLDGRPLETVVGGDREIVSFSLSADGERIAFAASDPAQPYDVYVTDTRGGPERRLTHANQSLLEELELAPATAFETTSSDGETVHGWLLEPVGAGPKSSWPLVLEVHGGPEAMYAWTFMHEFQVLAARGYGVLYTNPRGSRGYGEAFTARIFADWGNQDAADCLASVDAVSRLAGVDADRIGVTGGSYGGFMTAWLVGHTDRFKAAVAQRGCYNLSSFYGTSDIGPWFGDYIMGGPVYEREALYRERSPLTYAPAMRTPLRLIHSENDLRCPVEQAEQLFVHLRRLGKVDVDFIRFPEESHNLSRSGRPDRRVERLQRIVEWFDRYLSDGTGARPKRASSSRTRRTRR